METQSQQMKFICNGELVGEKTTQCMLAFVEDGRQQGTSVTSILLKNH